MEFLALLYTVLLVAICLQQALLLYRSGATGMDSLNGYIMQYQLGDAEGGVFAGADLPRGGEQRRKHRSR